MGGNMSAKEFNDYWMNPRQYKIIPDPRAGPSFDPMLGFPNGRKERVVKSTKEDIHNWQVPTKHRDYCVDHYIEAKKCWEANGVLQRLVGRCNHELHVWHGCLYEDKIMMSKEYEREKRLLARQKRRIAMGLEEDPSASQADAM